MPRPSRALASAALAATIAAGAVAPAVSAESLIVQVDRAKIVRLDQPASTIILGNPSIADALVQDRRMLVITGKSFGATNLIVLDEEGREVGEMLLHVQAADDGVITMQRGSSRVSFSCAPVCERTLRVGDTNDAFGELTSQIQTRTGLSQGN